MQFLTAIAIAIIFAFFCFLIITWKNKIIKKTFQELSERENSYTFIYEGFNWGPEITKLIINSPKSEEKLTKDDLSPESFTVQVTSESNNNETISIKRPVLKADFCDIDGNIIEENADSANILLTFDINSYSNDFSPFIKTDSNYRWKNEYSYVITHKKFTTEIFTTNDPIVLESALEKIKDLELKY